MLWLGIRIFNSSIISMLRRGCPKKLCQASSPRLCLPRCFIPTSWQCSKWLVTACWAAPASQATLLMSWMNLVKAQPSLLWLCDQIPHGYHHEQRRHNVSHWEQREYYCDGRWIISLWLAKYQSRGSLSDNYSFRARHKTQRKCLGSLHSAHKEQSLGRRNN